MRWSLQRLKFLLGHIGDFIDNDWEEVQKRARDFAPQTGLSNVTSLVEPPVDGPEQILERLTPFFDSGLLLRDWRVTDVFWRGSVFRLEPGEQAPASHLTFSSTPLQVQRAPAEKILSSLKMEFLNPAADAHGYLVQPTPQVGFVLFSNLADPWALEHVSEAHRLINKAFVY